MYTPTQQRILQTWLIDVNLLRIELVMRAGHPAGAANWSCRPTDHEVTGNKG